MMTGHLYSTAARFPRVPSRDELPEDERAAYDHHQRRVDTFATGTDLVDGKPYGVPHFEALLVSPPVAAALSGPHGLGRAVRKTEDQPGSYTYADHELIDMVLAFDSDYWALVAGHTRFALAAGVRIECLEALADGAEERLTTVEREDVAFIRAVRDGDMTDELWWSVRDRFGSERGVIDYVAHILTLLFHHRFCWAVGAPEMRREDWRQLIAEFKDGTRSLDEAKEFMALHAAVNTPQADD